jgi:hypothetical protein
MRHWSVVLIALWIVTALPSQAKPLDPALQQQLVALYDSYNKAIAAGKLQDALAFRTTEARSKAQKEMKTPKDRQELLTMAKQLIPDTLEVRHATISSTGNKAELLTVVSKTFPPGKQILGGPPPGSTVHSELTLSFARQGKAWKLDDLLYGGDPADIVACKDDSNEPMEAYDPDKEVSLGGPIVRVDFKPEYTLVVVRVVDEENCAFLPNRAEIAKHGLDPATLVPYAIVDITASPHRTNKQKVLIEHIKVLDED